MPRNTTEACLPARQPHDQQRTDDELLQGIRQGSEADFNVLYERYFQRIYNFVYVRLHNHSDAEEVVQETFTSVFRSIDTYRGQSALLSWVYGIAKNTLHNHLRRMKAQEERIERAAPHVAAQSASFSACTPEESLNLREYADSISEQLQAISTWQVEVFVLRHVDNLSIRDIARRTARSSDAIRSSLYRVKRMLVEAAGPPVAALR